MKLTSKLTFKSQSASSKEKFCPTNNLSTDYNTVVEGQPLHTAFTNVFVPGYLGIMVTRQQQFCCIFAATKDIFDYLKKSCFTLVLLILITIIPACF